MPTSLYASLLYDLYIERGFKVPPPWTFFEYISSERGRIMFNLEESLEVLQTELQQMTDEEFDALYARLEME